MKGYCIGMSGLSSAITAHARYVARHHMAAITNIGLNTHLEFERLKQEMIVVNHIGSMYNKTAMKHSVIAGIVYPAVPSNDKPISFWDTPIIRPKYVDEGLRFKLSFNVLSERNFTLDNLVKKILFNEEFYVKFVPKPEVTERNIKSYVFNNGKCPVFTREKAKNELFAMTERTASLIYSEKKR